MSTRRIFYSLLTACLLLTLTLPATVRPALADSPSTGVIVPLYSYPGAGWSAVIQQKQLNPSVPMAVVVNPSSGPGGSYDSNYATWIGKMRGSGITVLGYVWTSYGARPIASVESDISTYKSWYGVNGIFFDEMSNVPGLESYYSTLNSYAKGLGLSFTVGNPGASVPASFVGTVDCLVVYENAGTPSLASLEALTLGLAKANFAVIAYNVSPLVASYVSSAARYVSYIFVTDGGMPAPYAGLPSYFATLVSGLTSPQVSLTVDSVDGNGNPVTGLWTVVSSGGRVVASGFTPLTINGVQGATYSVSVANYGSYFFNHWDDGSTNSVRTLVLVGPTTITAHYGVPSSQDLINVQSIGVNGAPISGLWTTVSLGGQVIASGFTPFNFYGSQGAQYVVSVSNYGNFVFSHWDNWSTNPSRTVTLTQSTWLTAIYST